MANMSRERWSFEVFNELGLQEFQALVIDYTSCSVLLKREGVRWVMPAYVGKENSYESSLIPQFVNARIREEVGLPLELWVLRQIWRKEMEVVKNREHSAFEKAVVLVSCILPGKENVYSKPTKKGYEWIPLEQANVYHLFPEAQRILAQEMEWAKLKKIPPNRLKWQRPGWIERKAIWFQDVLIREKDAKVLQPLIVERSTPLGTVVEAVTTKGRFFMKCSPPWQNDASYTKALSKIAPKYVSSPVAVDTEEQLMISEDYGRILVPGLFDEAEKKQLTRDFVKLQFLAAEKIEELVRAGMPDCREESLLRLLDWAANRPTLDVIADQGEHKEAVEFFRRNLDKLKREVKDLYSTRFPSTVTHNDLYLSNVYKRREGEEGFMFFDWAEGYLAHPMAGVLDGLLLAEYVQEWKKYIQYTVVYHDLKGVLESAQKVRVIIHFVLRLIEAERVEEPEATDVVQSVAQGVGSILDCFSDENLLT